MGQSKSKRQRQIITPQTQQIQQVIPPIQFDQKEKVIQIIFKENSKNKQLLCQKIINELKKQKFRLNYGKYIQQKWNQIFQQIDQCNTQTIDFGYNQYSNIAKQISHVKFNCLKQLILYRNKIQNMQIIALINLNSLETLCLQQNRISRTKIFDKFFLPALKHLSLESNPFKEINDLCRSQINYDKFDRLILEQTLPVKNPWDLFYQVQSEDLSIIAKLNCKSMKLVEVGSYNRIQQKKILSIMKIRFLKIDIISTSKFYDFY